MSRYKGRPSAKAIERDFPHVVETVVPPNGLGMTLNDMYGFHARYGIRAHTFRRRDETGHDYICWCFADLAVAKSFAAVFTVGGSPNF